MIGHIILAVLIQALVAFLLRNWVAGAFTACAWSISRELAQAEYRWIEAFGGGRRVNMPWWGGLDPHVWQRLDPWLDWLAPSLMAIAIACGAKWIASRRLS
jgi:hypothetical protein